MNDASGCQGGAPAPRPPLWEVYADLCETPAFRERVPWPLHGLVVRYLVHSDCRRRAALELHQLVTHRLFGAAGLEGRRTALANPGRALRLLQRLQQRELPAAAARQGQADALAARHLARLPGAMRRRVHRWVLRRAETLERAFFEARPGARAGEVWGQGYAAAPGQDWYQRCLATMSQATARRMCRGALDAPDATAAVPDAVRAAGGQSRSR